MQQPSVLISDVQTMLNQIGSASNEEEGIMFTVDVPSVPSQSAQAVLVSQDTSSKKAITPPSAKAKTKPVEIEAKSCMDASTLVPSMNGIAVLPGVLIELGYSWKTIGAGKVPKSVLASIKTTVVETPKHGKVEPSGLFWHYTPDVDYVGSDRVKFLVEAQGRRFSMIINILVHEMIDEGAKPRACELFFNKPIKKANMMDGQPTYATGWSPSLRSDFSQIAYNFTNLPGTAVGETTSASTNATITLDTNAAGHGWFIDA